MADELILDDLEDRQIGHLEKLETHRQGRLHRAFSLFVVANGEMLIHRRAYGKYHSGGLWTNACCSHPRLGEELGDAVVRRAAQELGLAVGPSPRELFSFVYRADFGDLSEYEYDHVFLVELDERPRLEPDPEEIAEVSWVPLAELRARLLEDPASFTAWFITAAPRVMRVIGDKP